MLLAVLISVSLSQTDAFLVTVVLFNLPVCGLVLM